MKYYKELLKYFKPYKWIFLAVSVMVIFSVLLGLTPPWITRYIIDNIIVAKKVNLLGPAVLIMIFLSLLQGIFDFFNRYLMEFMGQNIIHDLRTALYRHLNSLSFSFYDKSELGDIMSRLTADADSLKSFLGFGSISIFSNLMTLLGILIIMFIWNFKLTLIFLIILPLIVHAMNKYAKDVRPVFAKARKNLGSLTSGLRNKILGIEVIKIFGQENREIEEFRELNQDYFNLNVQGSKITALWMPYIDFIVGVGITAVIWIGGLEVINNNVSLGTLIGLLAYMRMIVRPVRQTGMMVSLATRADAAINRMFTVLDTEMNIKEKENAIPLEGIKGKINFENVNFTYKEGEQVLSNINLAINAGETVALVGPSGAGKSTLVQLIPRFYDLEQGRVLIDNKDVRDLQINSLRSQIGILMQDIYFFNASIAENIAYGKPEASISEIVEAAHIAQIDDFIQSLPEGYGSLVGERGVKLSGGQKQRIALARILLTDPGILIMDEPTSNVDVETEIKINKALNNVTIGRTTLIIAHRLWSIENADKIIVIDEGKIVETGTHRELLNKENGLYRKMYEVIKRDEKGAGEKDEGRI